MNDLEKAEELLESNGHTCVLVKDSAVYPSKERGVVPLLELIDSGRDFSSFYAADRVVGRAAALLYAYMRIKGLYAKTVSADAIEVLRQHNIGLKYEMLTPYIINRNGDDICPMERTVANIERPEEAVQLIKAKSLELQDRMRSGN